MNDPFFTAMNEALDRIYASMPGEKRIPLRELADARTWARKQGYRFWWLIDSSDALDCLCAMHDKDGKTVREWIGGCAYTMSREECSDVEHCLAWEQMHDTTNERTTP